MLFVSSTIFLLREAGAEETSCYTIKAITSSRGVENIWKTERGQLLQNDNVENHLGQFVLIQKKTLTQKCFSDFPTVIIGTEAGLEPGLSGCAPRTRLVLSLPVGGSFTFFPL